MLICVILTLYLLVENFEQTCLRPKSIHSNTISGKLLSHTKSAHGHAILGNGVSNMRTEPVLGHIQWWTKIENVRVGTLLKMRQAKFWPAIYSYGIRQHTKKEYNLKKDSTHTRNVPLALILCIKSYLFMSVANVSVREMALALLTTMSIPPNSLTAASTAACTCCSSRTSTTQGRHFPPAATTAK